MQNNLSMIPCITDPLLWIRINDGRLIEIACNYVNNNLNANTNEFPYIRDKILLMFETKPTEYKNLLFFGLCIRAFSTDKFTLDWPYNRKMLDKLSANKGINASRKVRAQLFWSTHTRPDISYVFNKATQPTGHTMRPQKVKTVNKTVALLKSTGKDALMYATFRCIRHSSQSIYRRFIRQQ